MAPLEKKTPLGPRPRKFEMTKRKEQWKKINEPLEKLIMMPLEAQPSVVRDLVSDNCYIDLAMMLNLPPIERRVDTFRSSVETIIPFIPTETGTVITEHRSLAHESTISSPSTATDSITSSQFDSESITYMSKKTNTEFSTYKSESKVSSEQYEVMSDFVEVEKKIPRNDELIGNQKAILKFLSLPEDEAATWRVNNKDVKELSEMSLEEQGDFLNNRIAEDFCDWMRKLGGNEKSFISEEILKELFQVGMDNPASRAICIKPREKRVLYLKLAEFLQAQEKSFHKVLTLHLNWDTKEEEKPSKLVAFSKSLPKDLRSKAPHNKTSETWLEWNKLSADQLSFADVYSRIKDLRSTKEYCKWMLAHPEHKRPQYLADQGMFNRLLSDGETSLRPMSRRVTQESVGESFLIHGASTGHLFTDNVQKAFNANLDKEKAKLQRNLTKNS